MTMWENETEKETVKERQQIIRRDIYLNATIIAVKMMQCNSNELITQLLVTNKNNKQRKTNMKHNH